MGVHVDTLNVTSVPSIWSNFVKQMQLFRSKLTTFEKKKKSACSGGFCLVLARGIKDLSPWCMLYADDIVLCGTRREEVEKKPEDWRRALKDIGLNSN